jgi:hypothetical protein
MGEAYGLSHIQKCVEGEIMTKELMFTGLTDELRAY